MIYTIILITSSELKTPCAD